MWRPLNVARTSLSVVVYICILRNDAFQHVKFKNWILLQPVLGGVLEWPETYLTWYRSDAALNATSDVGLLHLQSDILTTTAHTYFKIQDILIVMLLVVLIGMQYGAEVARYPSENVINFSWIVHELFMNYSWKVHTILTGVHQYKIAMFTFLNAISITFANGSHD